MYGKMKEHLSNTLAEIKEAGLYKEERLIESAQQAAITVKGKEVLNFCANNYLELTMELRNRYGNENVVAGYIPGAEPKGELKESGPSAVVDVTDAGMIESVVKEYNIDTIYNLAALLSVVAESKPKLAWKIGIDGLWKQEEREP